MKSFLLASSNAHKAEELNDLFKESGIKIKKSLVQLVVSETGTSYQENALIKAKAYFERFNEPTVADDSGLEVEKLEGELGVLSARFGGEGLNDLERCNLLLEKMQQIDDRQACFHCCLCVYLAPNEVYFFEGKLEGAIAKTYQGSAGFGYDPIFIPTGNTGGQTLAELADWKKENSHRARACQEAVKFFRKYVDNLKN